MRILSIDHGEKRIGLAISDLTSTIVSPLNVIKHVSRIIDAAQVAEIANQNEVKLIIIGQSYDEEGKPNMAGRRAGRFADELKNQTDIPIEMVDESFSTQDARSARIQLGISRKKRVGHQDEYAAVVILQSFLENRRQVNK